MNLAIDFNDQPPFQADEIDDERTDWKLPPETTPRQLTMPDETPQHSLALGLMGSEMSRCLVRHASAMGRGVLDGEGDASIDFSDV